MEKNSIIAHMNEHHSDVLVKLFNKYSNFNVKSAKLVDFDENGIFLRSDNLEAKVPFNGRVTDGDFVSAIKNLATSLKEDFSKIKNEINEFRNSFKSVVIASIYNDQAIASYSPLIKFNDNFYIYISEISEHFKSISINPDKIEILFLQDENETASIILRKRLTYKTNAVEIPRDSDEFNGAMTSFLNQTGGKGGTKQISTMQDFHLFKLEFKKGRFVKGFGGAYDIVGDEISLPHIKNPHKF